MLFLFTVHAILSLSLPRLVKLWVPPLICWNLNCQVSFYVYIIRSSRQLRPRAFLFFFVQNSNYHLCSLSRTKFLSAIRQVLVGKKYVRWLTLQWTWDKEKHHMMSIRFTDLMLHAQHSELIFVDTWLIKLQVFMYGQCKVGYVVCTVPLCPALIKLSMY